MLLYITLGTNDLGPSQKFYDAVTVPLGIVRLMTAPTEIGYGLADHGGATPQGTDPNAIKLWITTPFDGRLATVGNGSMPAFAAATHAAVKAFYQAGLANGGTDEGAPGNRYRPNFYACYLRDPDGNKISAVCTAPQV